MSRSDFRGLDGRPEGQMRVTCTRAARARRRTVAAMPDLSYPQMLIATGTAGAEPEARLRTACATGRTPVDSGGLKAGIADPYEIADFHGKTGNTAVATSKSEIGPRGGTADATDL